MHCSPGLSCIDHVTDHVLIMFGVDGQYSQAGRYAGTELRPDGGSGGNPPPVRTRDDDGRNRRHRRARANGRPGSEEKAAEYYNVVEEQGWTPFSMANDWKTIYGDDVEKTELPAE